MKKQFRLEKVLDFRNRVLEREKAKLGELAGEERVISGQIAEITGEISNKIAEQEADAAAGRFDFASLYNKYIAVRENDLKSAKKKREVVLSKIETQKKVLQNALNDLKIMEKLKEKHLRDYAEYVLKQEALQIDEINITKRRDDVF